MQRRPATFNKTPPELADSIWLVDIAEVEVSQPELAVLFYLARWSGPCIAAWRTLTRELLKVKEPLEVLLIDADACNDMPKLISLFGAVPHGYGETCWIRNGEKIGPDVLGKLNKGQAVEDLHELLNRRIQWLQWIHE